MVQIPTARCWIGSHQSCQLSKHATKARPRAGPSKKRDTRVISVSALSRKPIAATMRARRSRASRKRCQPRSHRAFSAEILEAIWRQFDVAHRVLNVPVIETGLEGPSIVAFVGRSPQAWQSMRGHLCPPGSGRRSRGRSIRFPDPGLCELGAGVPRRTVRRRRLPGRPLHESTESTAAGLVRETDGGNSASSYQGRRS